MFATLENRIDWDAFPRTHQHLGSIPTQVAVMCRACGDIVAPGAGAHLYGRRPAGGLLVLMCHECHDLHAQGGRS
jgi:RNase P subunit RPR2